MRQAWHRCSALWILAVLALLGGTACTVNVGENTDGGTDGGDADSDADGDQGQAAAKFTWALQDADDASATYTCEEVGATYVSMQITVQGTTYDAAWYCTGASGSAATTQDFPTGEGSVKFELLDADGNVVATGVDENGDSWQDFQITLADGMNDFGQVRFLFTSDQVWDPTGTDATILYSWTINGNAPTAADCDQAGIDTMTLWIWNPDTETWWTDGDVMTADCSAGGIQPVDKFLAAGTYTLFGGFYKSHAPNPDVLVYYDDFDNADWNILAQDDPNDLGVLDIVAGTIQVSTLTLDLQWQDSQGHYQTDCTKAGVKKMGFLLRSDGWVAAEVPLTPDQAIDCLDQVVFEGVPYDTYEFLAQGMGSSQHVMWYNICKNIAVNAATTDYTCQIAYQVPGQK